MLVWADMAKAPEGNHRSEGRVDVRTPPAGSLEEEGAGQRKIGFVERKHRIFKVGKGH